MLPALDDLRDQLKTLRAAADLTQQEAAEQAEVSQSFVAKLERGTNDPGYARVARLYNTLLRHRAETADTVQDRMTAPITHCAPDDTCATVADTLTANDLSQLPVLADGRSVGVITERALLDAAPDDRVETHMQPALPAVPPDTPVEAAKALLEQAPAVLVRTSDGSLNGIVTTADLI